LNWERLGNTYVFAVAFFSWFALNWERLGNTYVFAVAFFSWFVLNWGRLGNTYVFAVAFFSWFVLNWGRLGNTYVFAVAFFSWFVLNWERLGNTYVFAVAFFSWFVLNWGRLGNTYVFAVAFFSWFAPTKCLYRHVARSLATADLLRQTRLSTLSMVQILVFVRVSCTLVIGAARAQSRNKAPQACAGMPASLPGHDLEGDCSKALLAENQPVTSSS
jgi:hypothetical protein